MLDVARREGIDIPALCHQEGMAAWGACRLCMVEVEGLDKLQAACTTWVKDGQVVKTNTKRVRARRESYLKMYLSDHNAYCEAPCSHACPTHIDIPAYMAALASGDAGGAASIVREELPFPGILGRVCPRYCEPVCRRGDVDEPIAICALHRAAADHSGTLLVPGVPTGRRVAVIGAGPAGLAAAWFLTQGGHEVTMYDANEEPGGTLRYSIPEFRLPGKVVEKELEPLWDAGVRFIGESELGYEVDPDGLFDAGFDAVIISVGTWEEPSHVLPGDDAALNGLELLKRVREGRAVKFTQKVVVIGDGVTAFDVARTARRKGAKDVVVIAQHEADDIPVGARDLAAALEEGVKVEFGALTKKVKTKGGKAQGVECVRVVREKGRRKEVRGSRFELAATTVVMATGYAPRLGDSADYLPLADSRLIANYYTGRTPEEGVFAAGDAITGSQSVIHAVAGGKRSALAVDAWLRGEDLEELEDASPCTTLSRTSTSSRTRHSSASSANVSPSAPRVAQDGRERRIRRSRHHAQGRQAEAPHGHRPRGREGLQPRRRPRGGEHAACSASARATAPATCRRSASSTRSPTTSWSPRATWCARSSPSTSTPSSAAT